MALSAAGADAGQSLMDLLRAPIRQEANRRYREECGTVDIPDDAFRLIDVTADGTLEVAVSLGLATCVSTGAPSNFAGTGGALNQFWTLSAGQPVMLIGEMMHGYSPSAEGLMAFQHGSYCGNYSGASLCVTTYRWDAAKNGMKIANRRVYDDAYPGKEPVMKYDWSGGLDR